MGSVTFHLRDPDRPSTPLCGELRDFDLIATVVEAATCPACRDTHERLMMLFGAIEKATAPHHG